MQKSVLITGESGFLGKNLTQRLLDPEFEVAFLNERVEDSDFDKAVRGKDYIFHLAWQTDLQNSMENPILDVSTDIIGILHLLESCRKYNPHVKIIFPSTVTVIGEKNKIPSDENEKENPSSIYDVNKLMAEKYLSVYFKNYGIKYTCLRLSNIFGEHQRIDNPKRGVLNFMIGKSLRNKPLTISGDGNFIRDYSYVQNIIDAFILSAQSPNTDGEVYVIGSGEGKTFNEVVSKVQDYAKELYSSSSEIVHLPVSPDTHKINRRNFVADSSKFKEATGWFPRVSFEEGLKRTMEFYKDV
jgi:nucleoside-diphosphate-sugar epimerase